MFYWFGLHTKLEDQIILLIINVYFFILLIYIVFYLFYCLFIYNIVYLFILLINSGFFYPLNSLIGYSLSLCGFNRLLIELNNLIDNPIISIHTFFNLIDNHTWQETLRINVKEV